MQITYQIDDEYLRVKTCKIDRVRFKESSNEFMLDDDTVYKKYVCKHQSITTYVIQKQHQTKEAYSHKADAMHDTTSKGA